jgi:hypothetical protein
MIFEITEIANAGDIDQERVVIKALQAGDIGRFAVFRNRAGADSGMQSGNISNAYWFQDRNLKAGDLVVLYTKAGTRSEKASNAGSTSYFFYWGLKQAIWADRSFRAALVNTSTWQFFKL